MQLPMRTMGEPMCIEIGDEKGRLKEDETSDPDCGRSAKRGEKLLGRDGFDQE
jgi:hypothetical protein